MILFSHSYFNLLTGLIGSVALAIGLAFGSDGRGVAAQITQRM